MSDCRDLCIWPLSTKAGSKEIPGVEAILNCVICTEPYRSPKVLPCQHTFCEQCLQQLYTTFRQERYTILGQIACPVCNTKVILPRGGVTGLPDDFKIVQIREFLENTNLLKVQQDGTLCDICKFADRSIQAEGYCVQCARYMCNSCSKVHRQHPLFTYHSEVEIINGTTLALECEEHKEEIKFVCKQCTELVCLVCLLSKHSNHEADELAGATQKQKLAIGDLLQVLQDKLKQFSEKETELKELKAIQETLYSDTRHAIHEHTELVIEKVKENEKEMLDDLTTQHNKVLEQLDKENEDTGFTISNLDSLCEFTSGIIAPTQSFQLMAMYDHLTERIKQSCDRPCYPVSDELKQVPLFRPAYDVQIGTILPCNAAPVSPPKQLALVPQPKLPVQREFHQQEKSESMAAASAAGRWSMPSTSTAPTPGASAQTEPQAGPSAASQQFQYTESCSESRSASRTMKADGVERQEKMSEKRDRKKFMNYQQYGDINAQELFQVANALVTTERSRTYRGHTQSGTSHNP